MMKRDCRLDHRLKKQLLVWSNLAHPAFFPRVVRRMKLARVVKIDSGNVLDRIRRNVSIEIGSHFALNRLAITFAAVAPAPVAPLIVGATGFETSPTANTIGTFVSCWLFTTR